jgi:hypothetical protein
VRLAIAEYGGERGKVPKRARRLAAIAVLVCAWLVMGPEVGSASAQSIEGAWATEKYILKDGAELDVSGHIFFTAKEWTVLFFVMADDRGGPKRGSAEGGTYELDGDALTFTHHYHLSAGEPVASLPRAELRMSVTSGSEAATEPCRVELSERNDAMTIYFPSGNRMLFRKR